jgi:hypothetical protein
MTKHEAADAAEQPTKKSRRKLWITLLIIFVVIVIGFICWLYTGQMTAAKQNIFCKLPMPVALVESKHISSKELCERTALARELLTSAGQPTDGLESETLEQLIAAKKVEILANQNNTMPSAEELENTYQAILMQFPGQDEAAFAAELQNSYGIDLETFKNEVLAQSVMKENLSLWFNNQESLNQSAYTEARDLLGQLESGSNFDEVARKYTDDESSKVFAGDSGFVAYKDLLPEFQKVVTELAINDQRIIASRYGIHVLKLTAIESGSESDAQEDKNYNLQQIFIEPADFNAWLKDQSNNIRSVQLL